MNQYLAIAFIAAAFEAGFGYPQWLEKWISHPVVWIGKAISFGDEKFNRGNAGQKKIAGILLALSLFILPFGCGKLVEIAIVRIFPHFFAIVITAIIASVFIAQKSLYFHVKAVLNALEAGDIGLARVEVSKIIGRDSDNLDETAIARAAIETLAESFCDGVIAPIFWLAISGLGGIFAFKSISTADSMIGHKDEKYRDFGMAAARCDDVMNFIPARIAGFLLCLVGGGFKIMLRDNKKHQSPNSAWSEAAMAGALGRTLGGGAFYDGEFIARPQLGEGEAPNHEDLAKAIFIYIRACALGLIFTGLLAWKL